MDEEDGCIRRRLKSTTMPPNSTAYKYERLPCISSLSVAILRRLCAFGYSTRSEGSLSTAAVDQHCRDALRRVTIFTSDIKGAGTDATVFLTLHGKLDGKETASQRHTLDTAKVSASHLATPMPSLPNLFAA